MEKNMTLEGERRVQPSLPRDYALSILSPRISWGAVLAGVVVALSLQMFLGALGIGIGAGAIDPMQEQNPMNGMGVGAAVWLAVSALVSLFAGGWVAGRLASIPRDIDSMLHGVLTWGFTTLLTFLLLTTAVGGLIGGAMSALGQGASGAAQAAATAEDGGAFNAQALKERAQDFLARQGGAEGAAQRAQQEARQAEPEMRQAADTAAKGLSAAGLLSAGIMFLGALAAALGGRAGRPHDYRGRYNPATTRA